MGQGISIELYDLAQDPGEESNVAAEHPEVIHEFEEYLKSARFDSPNWPILSQDN